MNKIKLHSDICTRLNGLYERKNHDYGDSFGKSFLEYGMAMPCIRLEDKLNRLKALTKADAEVMDETIDDTLMDLANYAIMTLVEQVLSLRVHFLLSFQLSRISLTRIIARPRIVGKIHRPSMMQQTRIR